MNQAITAALQSWAQRATPEQLQAGPRATELAERALIVAVADELADSPLFPYLIDIAGHDAETPDDGPGQPFDSAVLHGVAHHARYSSYVSAITRLLTYPLLAARLGRPLERVLAQRAEAGLNRQADPATAAIGATALEAWLHLCTTQVLKPHRLLALLTDLPELVADVPTEMVKRLPRMIGLAHEHFADDDLLTLLRHLADTPEAEADANFETALADLRRALDAEDQDHLVPALMQARSGFAAVEAADEARHDAQAYAAALDAIMAFQHTDTTPLRDAATRLQDAVHQRHAWLAGGHLPPWAWARAQAETAWLQLSATLSAAAEPLHDACWYHPSQAVTALRDAYQAARTFTARVESGSPRGVELLIRPAIEATFITNTNQLALLDHALAHDPAFAGDEAAAQLHTAVHAALHRSQTATRSAPATPDEGGGGPGKEPSRLPAVLHHLGVDDAAALIANVPPRLQETLESILWNQKIARAELGNSKVERKLQDLQRDLATSPDWRGSTASSFKLLLEQTMLFLVSRYNIGATMGGERTAYLRTAGRVAALEKPFHQDYYEWLTQGPLYNIVHAETINRGRGRSDILVKFRNTSFSVELKRETDDASADGLRAYAGQAAVYTDTDTALGILLVLDLTIPLDGAADLFSSIWLEKVQRQGEHDPRYLVVARLPGKKPHPSATHTSPRRP
jgi:hypothetical protein